MYKFDDREAGSLWKAALRGRKKISRTPSEESWETIESENEQLDSEGDK